MIMNYTIYNNNSRIYYDVTRTTSVNESSLNLTFDENNKSTNTTIIKSSPI